MADNCERERVLHAKKQGSSHAGIALFTKYLLFQNVTETTVIHPSSPPPPPPPTQTKDDRVGEVISSLLEPLASTLRVAALNPEDKGAAVDALSSFCVTVTQETRTQESIDAAQAAIVADNANPSFTTSVSDGNAYRVYLPPMGPVQDPISVPYLDKGTPTPSSSSSSSSPNTVWEFPMSRRVLANHTKLKPVHEWLKGASPAGVITRQELVSMVPVAMVDIEPSARVLDMCAAPGSKTAQIMESLDAAAGGFVVANEMDWHRSHLLTTQVSRLRSPCAVVTSHKAQFIPTLTVGEGKDASPFRFDVVLADVPCTGDGTMRKNPNLVSGWSPSAAASLHETQMSIALRGAKLTALGGTFVYSTCSLNPVEDEAVVAQILARTQGGMELVDCSQRLPWLKRREGVTSWGGMLNSGETFSSPEECPENCRATYGAPSMFPPPPESGVDLSELKKTMRILPSDQNTGGFFIAVFRKVAHFSLEIKNNQILPEPDDTLVYSKNYARKQERIARILRGEGSAKEVEKYNTSRQVLSESKKKKLGISMSYELPFSRADNMVETCANAMEYFGFTQAEIPGSLVARHLENGDIGKALSFVPSSVVPLLDASRTNSVLPLPEGCSIPRHPEQALNIVSVGLRFLVGPRNGTVSEGMDAMARFSIPGLQILGSFLTRHVFPVPASTIRPLFALGPKHESVNSHVAIPADVLEADYPELAQFYSTVQSASQHSSFVAAVSIPGRSSPMYLPGWVTPSSIAFLISKRSRPVCAFILYHLYNPETIVADIITDADAANQNE